MHVWFLTSSRVSWNIAGEPREETGSTLEDVSWAATGSGWRSSSRLPAGLLAGQREPIEQAAATRRR